MIRLLMGVLGCAKPSLRLPVQDAAVGGRDDDIGDMVDRHQALHKLVKRLPIFENDPSDAKMVVMDGVVQQDHSQFLQVFRHRRTPSFNEIPTQ